MTLVGIDDLSAYCGLASVDVTDLCAARGIDRARSANLGMRAKTVALPGEDAVSYAVNAARPLLRRLGPEATATIELLVVGTESGLDFSKSLGTWIHALLGLPRTCRTFEIKQACYGGLAALQSAVHAIAATRRDQPRALVIAVDVPRLGRHTTAEPSQGAGAVAALVTRDPRLLAAEAGAAGYWTFDVTDVRRPTATDHIWDPDLSLHAYIECLKGAWQDYAMHAPDRPAFQDLDHLVFHTPFPGAVRGAHRSLMRHLDSTVTPHAIAADYAHRLEPSTRYPAQVGNLYAGTTLLAILSALERSTLKPGQRIGVFSYGSGCSAEFTSLRAGAATGLQNADAAPPAFLTRRQSIDVPTYDTIAGQAEALYAGVADYTADLSWARKFADPTEPAPLMLASIDGPHRSYRDLGD